MPIKWVGLLLGISLLSACARVPTAPSVMALPATGKPLDVFQAEDAECRAYAQHQVAVAATTRQSQYDIPYSQCMYSKGNALPEVVAPGPRVPLPPPGTPPPAAAQSVSAAATNPTAALNAVAAEGLRTPPPRRTWRLGDVERHQGVSVCCCCCACFRARCCVTLVQLCASSTGWLPCMSG